MWMKPLGASRRVFGNWPAAGRVPSPQIAVTCSSAGWGQSAVPAVRPPRRGHRGKREAGGVLLCAASSSLPFVRAKVPFLSLGSPDCSALADLPRLALPPFLIS